MIIKTLAVALSAAFSLSAFAAVQDGVYEGAANGRSGPVTTQITIKDGKIADVKVIKDGESAMISDAAKARIPQAIVDTQSLRVDGVSGATLTSQAIMAGATEAVKKAGGS
jgi:fumarate reductase flavoprotein subunit